MPYSVDRKWSDKMIPQIKSFVGPHLLQPAAFELDAKQATDLMVLTARDMRIAARVRRPGYLDKYRFEITLRCKRDSGAETELSKVVNGWGDWLFYGHADKEDQIVLWWLVCLNAFRAGLIRNGHGYKIKCGTKDNKDGTHLKAYDWRTFPPKPPILIASSHPLPGKASLNVIDGSAA